MHIENLGGLLALLGFIALSGFGIYKFKQSEKKYKELFRG